MSNPESINSEKRSEERQVPFTSNEENNSHNEQKDYEVVFFVRYNEDRHMARPSLEDMTSTFNKYGEVDHINYPENRNFAFVFMKKLNTTATYRRTRTAITQIINDMTPETRFFITVARKRNNQWNNFGRNDHKRNWMGKPYQFREGHQIRGGYRRNFY
jgi:ribosomal protein S6